MTRPMPPFNEMMRDPKLVSAAKAIWDDHYRADHKTEWADLPDMAPLGERNYKRLCMAYAWSVFEAMGFNRL